MKINKIILNIILINLIFFKINFNLEVKKNTLAGNWYSNNKKNLLSDLKKMETFSQNNYGELEKINNIFGIISPHAGYKYSGSVASSIYKILPKNFYKKIIILGPSHFSNFKGISLPSFNFFETPLGTINLDRDLINKILESPKNNLFKINNDPYLKEHSIEIQIPFIQKYLNNAKILPLLVGQIDELDLIPIAETLSKFIDNETLFIISSDFIHHGDKFNFKIFNNNTRNELLKLNSKIINSILNLNFDSYLNYKNYTICGYNCILIFMQLLKNNIFGNYNSKILAFDSSDKLLDANPEMTVNYCSIAFFKNNEKIKFENELSNYEKKILSKTAKYTLENLYNENISDFQLQGLLTNNLLKNYGAFVTLKKNGRLRGCIGKIHSNDNLINTIINMTKSAALNDNRFEKVLENEIKNIDISISILNTPKKINSYKDITLGKDGIILRKNSNSAVFLPKVAIEQNWNLEETLNNLALKAGLNKNSWKDSDCILEIFQTIDF